MPTPEQLDGASIPELLGYLSSADPSERADAACALGDRLRTREALQLDPPVIETLAALLDDGVPIVRLEAAIALAEAHDRRAVELLLNAARHRTFRLDAIRSLGTLGDPAAIEPLRRLLRRWLLPWADKLQAAAALCALGDPEGAALLRDRLGSRRQAERAAAIHFIGESRHPDALALLSGILKDVNDPMRDVAARALGLLGSPEGVPSLVAAQQGAPEELHQDIEEALARLGREGALRGGTR